MFSWSASNAGPGALAEGDNLRSKSLIDGSFQGEHALPSGILFCLYLT